MEEILRQIKLYKNREMLFYQVALNIYRVILKKRVWVYENISKDNLLVKSNMPSYESRGISKTNIFIGAKLDGVDFRE